MTDLIATTQTVAKISTDDLQISRGYEVSELLVIDAAVEDKHLFYQQLKPGVAVVEIQSGESGLAQLTQILSQYQGLNALHIMSHASDGVIQLGSSRITEEVLKAEVDTLAAIDGALKDGADLLLYGCNIAEDDAGESLLQLIASEANVDVAASDDLTGATELGGDWDLEIHKGDIETELPFSEVAQRDFSALLGITGGNGTIDFSGFPSGVGNYYQTNTYSTGGVNFKIASDRGGASDFGQFQYGYVGVNLYGAPGLDKIYFYFDAGETFDATSITLYNNSTDQTFKFTSDKGDSYTKLILGGGGFAPVTLGFTGITKLTIENNVGGTDIETITFDDFVVANVTDNAVPTLASTPTDITVVEDTASDVNLSPLAFADADGDPLTVTLAVDAGVIASSDGNGTFGGVTITNSGTASMTLSGTIANIHTYLDTTTKIKYTGASNANGNDAATLTVSATDGNGGSLASNPTINLDITAVNDNPTISSLPASVTVTEDTQSNIALGATSLADVDGDNITVTLAASAGIFATPADGAGVGAGVTETLVNGTTMTLVGAAADINTYLDTASNIQYTAASNVSGNAAATLTVTANDGAGSGEVNLGTVNIDVTAVNDNPAVPTLPAAITVIEDSQSNVDLTAASFADIDSASITVTLTASAGTFATPADGVGVGGGVTETLQSATIITLVGAPADINTYLDTASNIQYTGAANASGNAAATITVTANDGDGSGNVNLGTVNVNITGVNDNPSVSSLPASVTVTEDTQSNIALGAMSLADVDGDNITVTLAASAGIFATPADGSGVGAGVTETLVNATTMTLVGAAADINTYLDTASNIQYTAASNVSGNAAASITFTANDGAGSGDVNLGTVNIDVTAVNDDPAVATLPASVTVTKDSQSNVDLSATSFADIDSASITVTLTASAGTFATPADGAGVGGGVTETLQSATVITLVGAPADINTYLDTASKIQYTGAANASGNAAATITVTANDGDGSGNVNLGTVNVNITAVNDNPSVSSLPASVTVTEDTQSNIALGAMSFADADGDNITVTLTASAGIFATPVDGAGVGAGVTETLVNDTTMTLVGAAADINTYLDTPSNIQYTAASNVSGNAAASITVTANDGAGSGDVNLGTVNIDVTAVNDNPTVATLPASITVTEDSQSNVDLTAASFADIDSASITVTLTTSAGIFASPADGAGVGGGVTETLQSATVITLVGAPADINTYLDTASNIQYTGASNIAGNNAATVTVRANDSDGSGDIVLAAVNLNISNTSDAPSGSDKAIALAITDSYTFGAEDFGFSDPDSGDNLNRVQVSGQTIANGLLTLNGTAVSAGTWIPQSSLTALVYKPAQPGDDSFTFIVEDDSTVNAKSSTVNTISLSVTNTETVDGVVVETTVVTNDDGTTTEVRTIPPVTEARVEDDGTPNTELADIPLQFGNADKTSVQTIVSLPVGVGLISSGEPVPKSTDEALENLLALTNRAVSDSDNGKGNMLSGAQKFLENIVEDSGELVVNSVVLTLAEGVTEVPQRIVITGSPSIEGGVSEALVIDASNLPLGTVLDLSDVEFAVIIGPVTLRGGAGANIVYAGAGNQNIVLGEDDDELHGGDGDDTIGSEGGDDLLFGDSGNDTLFGGDGADMMHGGSDTDTILYSGNASDYTVSQFHGLITVTSVIDPTDTDTLINVELIEFADQQQTISYDTKLIQIASLYDQVFDRQADLGGFQYWAERSATTDSLQDIAVDFLWSEEAEIKYGLDIAELDNAQAIEFIYVALLGRESDADGKAFWLGQLDAGEPLEAVAEDFLYAEEYLNVAINYDAWDFLIG